MKRLIHLIFMLVFASGTAVAAPVEKDGNDGKKDDGKKDDKNSELTFSESFVKISTGDPRYFVLSNGEPYIPIGCNIAAMGTADNIRHYMARLHENGANFGRVWLNTDVFEIETVYGEIREDKLANIDLLLTLALEYDIKIKMCIESFRHISPGRNQWDTKASYHVSNGGPFNNSDEYITSRRGRDEFLNRVGIFRERYGDHPAVFGWEMWNEMNAVSTTEEHLREWNEYMLPQVKKIFPENLVMNSLGSLDREWSFPIYEFLNKLPSNEVAQVHRYLDEGAELEICSAPVDVLAADAIDVLRGYGANKPMLLAESGAVLPNHAGPHTIYRADTEGTVLHDVLFAPFFSGSAGPGHLWHWDHHIDKQNTWFQMQRFANAVEGIDPAGEKFEPVRLDVDGLRVYVLKGADTTFAWCRDTESTWQSELRDGIPAKTLKGKKIDFGSLSGGREVKNVRTYDPWKDEWAGAPADANVGLPDFVRSIVVKIEY